MRGRRLGAAFGMGYLILGSLCGLQAGCRDVEKIEIPNVFREVPERPIADVPVPIGFRFVERGSYIFDDTYRVAKLRYTGGTRLDEVVLFYREQMPLSRWDFLRVQGDDQRVLEFQSPTENCVVTLQRKSGMSSIEIEIQPRSI